MKNNCDILIIGGGTAGWLSAAYLSFQNPDKKIILVEDPNIPTIGVGEGTFPSTMYLLNKIGIKPKDLIVKSNGSLKMGIEYTDFAENKFWLTTEPTTAWELFGSEMVKSLSAFDKCPILLDDDSSFFGCHFVASDLVEVLKEHAKKHGVIHISDKVIDVKVNHNFCDEIHLESGDTLSSKWFIDSTGFAKVLISKTDSPFKDYSKELLVDSAVVSPTQYKNKKEEFKPYTKITAKECGWMFKIPTWSRIGNGYVYSSAFINKESAEKVLKDVTGVDTVKHLKMTLGYYDKLINGNIVAVGLSGGFIEPMEATAIHLTERTLIAFDEVLKGEKTETEANQYLRDKIRYIKTLILAHYALSERTEPFWLAARQAAENSEEIKEFFGKLKNGKYPTSEDKLDVAYPYCQWNELLKGFGKDHYYPNINSQSKKELYLASYYLPNHFDYINKLRGNNNE